MKPSLEDQIRELSGPSVSEARKVVIKDNIFASIRLSQEVKNASLETEMSLTGKVQILERLKDFIESRNRRFSFFTFPAFRRQFAAGLLMMILVISGFSFVNVDTHVVFAAEFTQLTDVNGEVVVQRGGEKLDGYRGMQLYEQDKVFTSGNSLAVVRFFDDSVSRLYSETILKIDELKNYDSGLTSYVKVEVESGQVWSKVVSLVAENSAFIVKSNGISAEAKRGAFNLEVTNDKRVVVGVFNNEVKVTGEKFSDQVKVVSGQKIVASDQQLIAPKVFDLSSGEKDGKWAKNNLSDDKKYIVDVEDRLIVAKMESVGLKVDESVSLESSVREDALKFLTFDDINQHKLSLDLAEKKFVSAQIKLLESTLSDVERGEAEQAIEDFYLSVKTFYEFADSVATTDKNYADELRKYAQDKVLRQKKALSATLPDSPYYFAKDVIAKIELIGADGMALAKIKQNQAQDKLSTVEEIVNSGNLDLATKVLGDYQKDISDVITILDADKEANVEDKNEIIQNVKDNSVMLKTIDKSSDVKLVPEVIVPVEDSVSGVDKVSDDTQSKEDVKKDELSKDVEKEAEDKILDSKLNFNFQIKQNLDFSNLITDGPFGVQIQGDKPLDPLL